MLRYLLNDFKDHNIESISTPLRYVGWRCPFSVALKGCHGIAARYLRARCIDTGWVVRRSAIDQLGGLLTESIQEDFVTSLLLSMQGWKTVYI